MPDREKSEREKNPFSARAARYARVGANVGGVAARYAGRRLLGSEPDRAGEASALSSALGRLKGPLMKVAQLMATIPDALPPEYASELQKLQSEAPPMGWAFVKRRMTAELGADWLNKFSSFEHHTAAAARMAVRGPPEDGPGDRHHRNRQGNRRTGARGARLPARGPARRALSRDA